MVSNSRPRINSHRAQPTPSQAQQPPIQTREISRSRLGQAVLFARNFLKHPNLVGWMLPSSPFVVEQVLKQVDWNRARVIVEYGPGVGTFTKPVLRRMHPDARLIALEINPEFVDFLSGALPDPRLRVIEASAADVDVQLARLGYKSADYVISGIPFKTLPKDLCHQVALKTHAVLRPKGAFLVYQLSSTALRYLQPVFSTIHQEQEWLSFMPARMFYCVR